MKKIDGSRVDVQKIKKYMQEHKLSQAKFAQQCGMSVCTLNHILCSKPSCRLQQLLDIAAGMQVQIKEILKDT